MKNNANKKIMGTNEITYHPHLFLKRTLCKMGIYLVLYTGYLFFVSSSISAEIIQNQIPLGNPSPFYEAEMQKMIGFFKEHKQIKLFQSKDVRFAIAKVQLTGKMINTPLGKRPEVEKIIIYNPNDFENVDKVTGTKYASLGILAHEIGHHYNEHLVNETTLEIKRPTSTSCESWGGELEADFFSGLILGLMGASDKEVISAYTYLFSEKGSYSHPDSEKRISIVITGLHAATKQGPSKEHADAIINQIKTKLNK
ncbi:MAG: hypothetical protein Q8K51_14040 [Nitrospirota bacterium]|nr:hypothetical protein [Nitrospirota bacterium]